MKVVTSAGLDSVTMYFVVVKIFVTYPTVDNAKDLNVKEDFICKLDLADYINYIMIAINTLYTSILSLVTYLKNRKKNDDPKKGDTEDPEKEDPKRDGGDDDLFAS